MSWDVMVFDLGGALPAGGEMAPDFKPKSMGAVAEVRSRISEHLATVDWSDGSWGMYEGDGFGLEFNMGKAPETDGFMVHFRGSGDAIAALLRFAAPNGWSLFDCSTGEFIDPANPSNAGWEAFQGYRDRVIRS